MSDPSTGWREQIGADEAARHERQAQRFGELQRERSARYGPGRALHRHQRVALRASFEVLGGLPEPASHGLFARTGAHEALVRLSSGGFDVQPDEEPDIRGFSVTVLGVGGPGALGFPTESQDFALINHEHFSSPDSAQFTEVTTAAAGGLPGILRALVRRPGLVGGVRRIKSALDKPFTGFATEDFFSAAPLACGPYAIRVALRAAAPRPAIRPPDLAADLFARLAQGPLVHELQVQFFTDEASTPIEDASVNWASPYVTVARLTIPPQAHDPVLAARAESGRFDPWNALAEHRPLGEVMRARKVAYRASQLGRGTG
jgi:hypothetical protein